MANVLTIPSRFCGPPGIGEVLAVAATLWLTVPHPGPAQVAEAAGRSS